MNSGSSTDSEEEILIYAEFADNVKVEHFRSIHVLGINTKNPVIQLDNTFLNGKYESPVGTHMFFESDYNAKSQDPLFDKLPEQNLKFLCQANKYLNMQCAEVTPKAGTDASNKQNEREEDLEIENFNSVQEAVEKFKKSWKPTCNEDAQIDISELCESQEKLENPG